MSHDQTDHPANRLVHETSPYLLQHAHNPVDWYPWGPEALERAQAEDMPILLSIGYSACHWCHVMERESFENPAIAAAMNANFVCIKVDREERPDLDAIYMDATMRLNNGQGGWPMTVFLTPTQQPFFAGTYFPPVDRHGRVGFGSVLKQLHAAWVDQREALENQATLLTQQLQAMAEAGTAQTVGYAQIDKAVARLAEDFDPTDGGFGHAPKFPPSAGLSLLLRHHIRSDDNHALTMVHKTLTAMARGGLYDHIGGGFARYSTDSQWLVPHFEKMLYDNALLVSVYLEAYQLTQHDHYRQVATETLDYVLREMTSERGGFYSALDADSEGVEGKFYVWRMSEVIEILGDNDGIPFCAYYDITEMGNWEGNNIPNTPKPMSEVAATLGIPESELATIVSSGRAKLYKARQGRIPPGTDDKVLTSWNALMIAALAEGFRVLEDRRYLDAAVAAADFIESALTTADGCLLRTFRDNKAHLNAYLEDYAYLCDALVTLYEAGGEQRFLGWAENLAQQMLKEFRDEASGGFLTTSNDHEALLIRRSEPHDGAIPSANSIATTALLRLAGHLNRPAYKQAAIDAIEAFGDNVTQFPRGYCSLLASVDRLLSDPVEIALVQGHAHENFQAFHHRIGQIYLPNRIIALSHPVTKPPATQPKQQLPLLEKREPVDAQTTVYICQNYTCEAPFTDLGDIPARLQMARERDRSTAKTQIRQRLAGHATPAGTERYVRSHGGSTTTGAGYGLLGNTQLRTSRIGFGGYRVTTRAEDHRAALKAALLGGCNLIDTSTNYANGDSERLVGRVVSELVGSDDIARDEIIIVSKIGYVQGDNLELAKQRERSNQPFTDMVHYTDKCWHCIEPAFLADQLSRSLDRLNVDILDICLLHNPEYFLLAAKDSTELSPEDARQTFYDRIRSAFEFLESQCQAGTIGYYGVSSNTFIAPADANDATCITTMHQIATDVGGADHHFRVLQLPLNLLETGAATISNNGPTGELTALEEATRHNLAVLANRPLNAIVDGALIRLADYPAPPVQPGRQSFATLLDGLNATEARLRDQLNVTIPTERGDVAVEQFFHWGEEITGVLDQIQSISDWARMEQEMIQPRLAQIMRFLEDALRGDAGEIWQKERGPYLRQITAVFARLSQLASARSQERSAKVSAWLNPMLPEPLQNASLSQKALTVLANTKGISTVLCGMRHPEYVKDALGILDFPVLETTEQIYNHPAPDAVTGPTSALP